MFLLGKRKLSNLLVKPEEQGRELFLYSAILLVLCVAFLCVFTINLKFYLSAAIEAGVPFDFFLLKESLVTVTLFSVIHLLLFIAFLATFLIYATHRFYGPVFAIERHLMRYLAGEEVGPLKLRKKDHLQQLCDQINAYIAE